MSDDKSKDPKAKSAASAENSGGVPHPKKPKAATPKPPKDAVRESDLFPAEDDDADALGAKDTGEVLFDDEGAGDEEGVLDATLGTTDTSERIILVVDEEGQRRNETVAIISQILPNAEIEVADDPEEALDMMAEEDFDTFVVNFLMPGYSSSPFVKAVANHPEHPLLIGFAADKMSDAVDPKKGLKIIPLKRLFDLDTSTATDTQESEPSED